MYDHVAKNGCFSKNFMHHSQFNDARNYIWKAQNLWSYNHMFYVKKPKGKTCYITKIMDLHTFVVKERHENIWIVQR